MISAAKIHNSKIACICSRKFGLNDELIRMCAKGADKTKTHRVNFERFSRKLSFVQWFPYGTKIFEFDYGFWQESK